MNPSAAQIDVRKAKELIDQGTVTIVDIRNPQAYQSSHIPNAILITDHNLKSFLQSTDKNVPVLCYCYHGFSSQSAAQYFAQQGFRTSYSLIGGFERWQTSFPAMCRQGKD